MSTIDVSVILAAYNGVRYIEETIRAVLAQTHAALELIVIDDGSTDGTWELVNRLRAADPRIVYAFQPNGRQGRARNNGIRRARGALIAFCDQDDLWVEDKLEVQLRALARTKDVGVVFSDGFLFKDDDVADESRTFGTLSGVFDGPEMFRLLFVANRVPILSALVRKEALLRVGLLNEDPAIQNCDDWDLWLRLARSGARFLGLAERLVRYRLHAQQASSDVLQMMMPELSVLEQFRASPLLGAGVADRELAARYARLVDSLVEAGRTQDAAAWSLRWWRADRAFAPLWRSAVCRLAPHRYGLVRRALSRSAS